ncbi:50S ribosomal protein L19e [Halopenitus persicus]|uniref:Large ribosomal subunit protein eL19 n=1 Tax=Halopenitus persicus TaxID=1048396 RepID=A0A1H3MTS1_9EURY|nr:50S ribosomal protein L19e [Halopenitus persicus]QHS16245.1 50S ribosomal protein L19e [haloarchaeon 3A1-DGR]SDY80081.1 LSU ribosomal protein L19E [Halopenitus persicus]
MTDLSAQKRLAADELDVGKGRVWFDPEAQEEIADAITREDVRDLIDQGTIRATDAKSNSRGRARERDEKRSYGHRTGAGSRKGKSGARKSDKDDWMARIRAQRARLKELRDEEEVLDPSEYRTLYNKASGGDFDDVARLEAYIETQYGYEVSD